MTYDDVVASPAIGQFFDLADIILISAAAMQDHLKSIDMTGVTKDNPINTKLPSVDLTYLGLRDEKERLLPDRMQDAFSIVAAYWDSKGNLGINSGLVASLWQRGMGATDIIRCIEASTDKNGQIFGTSGRGHDIMYTVVDVYLACKGLAATAEISQAEMSQLVEHWLSATRSAPLKTKDASNAVLHWSEYRRLGLIDPSGTARLDQVRRVAAHVFAHDNITFSDLVDWVDRTLPQPKSHAPPANNPARAMLKKKRKQGKLNRKRGRR